MYSIRRLCVFCGSSPGRQPVYAEAAQTLGHLLAQHGIGLVYGGASVGLMGTVADAVLGAGGEAIGVIPRALAAREVAHAGLTDLQVVGSMHQRKARMSELADAFVALPGGFGTLEEFCEVLTWSQLGLQAKPCGLLNIAGYWSPLLTLVDHAVAEQFVRPVHRGLVLEDQEPARLLKKLGEWQAPALPRWVERDQT